MMRRVETDNFCGLKNQGFTCYLNALLQTLFRTPEFKNLIISSVHTLEKALSKLFKKLSSNSSSIGTKDVTRALKIDVMKQQDIADCFRMLLNKLDKKAPSKYSKIFQSRVVNTLECQDCHNTDELVQDFSVITLPVKPFLTDSLEEFWNSTTLDGQNEVYCNKCCKKTATTMTYTFKCQPRVLVIQLKRFMQCRNMFEKDISTVSIPLKLEVPYGNSKDKTIYSLYAMCNHIGVVNGGHYNAVIKCSEKWNEFDDKYCYLNCIHQSGSDFISSSNAYLLFYKKPSDDASGQPTDNEHNEGTANECKHKKKRASIVKRKDQPSTHTR
ncbi:ubiquitin carboxyl-terminal hydrolase 2-like isoform X2 [Protopterus annectens]|uniref:ubiquitin carboxyl-terminal hydrolase 2-like isoform X2 n=1 Tax=Protopterus annectens TaxID=7888 RepID=UPI001CFBD5BD|nr:ubiquitin carboxyl-terminal hydrolase 2-like isoform X2 [Protopterus annectens]